MVVESDAEQATQANKMLMMVLAGCKVANGMSQSKSYFMSAFLKCYTLYWQQRNAKLHLACINNEWGACVYRMRGYIGEGILVVD